MKNKAHHNTVRSTGFVAVCVSLALVCALPAVRADEYDEPVRPVGVNGQPAWNVAARQFMYAPTFDFKPVAGAKRYRFTVTGKDGAHAFEAERPTAALTPVWSAVPVGDVSVTVSGVAADGKVLGTSESRRFWKMPPFREGAYPKARRGYAETAGLIWKYVFNRPYLQHMLDKGEPDPSYPLNSYPAKMLAAQIWAMLRYAKVCPQDTPRAMRIAKAAADRLIARAQPAGRPLAYFPPTYDGRGEAGNDYVGEKFKGLHMLHYPAAAGQALLDYAAATGETSYRDFAFRIADTYVRLQGEDGTWWLKMDERDGKPVCPNRLVPIRVLEFLERVATRTGEPKYRKAAERAFGFIERGPLVDWNWEGQFEDIYPAPLYANLTKHGACDVAIYLLKRFPNDPCRLAQARELLRWSEDQFVVWDGRYFANNGKWTTPVALEQYHCYAPIDESAAKLVMTYLALYRAERKPRDLAKARALGDAFTRVTLDDGRLRTYWNTDRLDNEQEDWVNGQVVSALALEDLATFDGACGRPAQAPRADAKDFFPALDASDQAFYDAIFTPTVVGEQPNHTHKEMVRLPSGELRYYGTDLLNGVRTKVCSVSRDRGLSWKERLWDVQTDIGPMAYCPWGDYYFTGECLGNWQGCNGKTRFRFVTTKGGPTDLATRRTVEFPIPAPLDFFRPMQPFELSRTIAFGGACSVYDPATKRSWERPSLIFSDDDGATWRATVVSNCVTTGGKPVFNDKSLRWDNGCCESTLVELSSGEFWMACRASLRHHYLFKSKDRGRTWSGPEPMRGFYASNTMPTFLKLRDGRILFFWNNTEPLAKRDLSEYPELPPYAKSGTGETVFTNRDALHVAISEDDGKTWIGFREVALNALRNCEDYRARGNDRPEECDKSVHQTQPMELPGGKILLPYGQGAARRICIFDLRWIYEKGRYDDFWWGTEGLSNHLFLKSLNGGCRAWDAGHCAFNRLPGASIVREPDTGADTIRECLQVCRIRDERLISELQGVAWNFPAALKGELEIECRIDGIGFNLALCDRWINPGDEHAQEYAVLSVPIEADTLGGAARWTKLRLTWDWKSQRAVLKTPSREQSYSFSTRDFSPFGPSYLHVQTRATGHDPKGTYFRSFRML